MAQFIAAYTDENGKQQCWLYDRWEDYFKDTFSPNCKEKAVIVLSVKGKTYAERKKSLRDTAIYYSNMINEFEDLSFGELIEIQRFFRENGKRYGLLQEFKENCIC